MMFIALFAMILVTFGQKPGNEAYNEIISIQRILLQASEEVLDAENEMALEIVHLEVDIVLGKEYKYIYRNLSKGWTYIMYAEGENVMVRDLDMKVLKQDPITDEWYDVGEDNKENFGAIFATKVEETARYAIGIKVAAYEEGFSGCHYFLMIAHARPE